MGDGSIVTPEVQVGLRIIVSVPCLSTMYNLTGPIWKSDTSLLRLQRRDGGGRREAVSQIGLLFS